MKKIIYLLILCLLTGCVSFKYKHHNEYALNSYFYDNYTDTQKEVYDRVYDALADKKTEVNLDNCNLSKDEIFEIASQVSNDHPEFFYFYGDEVLESADYYIYTQTTLTLKYTYTDEEITEYQNQLDSIKQEYLNNISGMDEMEVIEYTYDYLIQNIVYDEEILEDLPAVIDSPDTYGIIGALIDHKCVCAGYASALEYLINLAGYNCLYIKGELQGESHAWNAIEINGEYFHFDATSDDIKSSTYPYTYYEFFGLNTSQIQKYHTIETPIVETKSIDYNYHVYHNQYITSTEELADCIYNQKNNSVVYIQCADFTLYQWAIQELITKKTIYNYLNCRSISYITEDNLFMIAFLCQ